MFVFTHEMIFFLKST